MFRRATFNKVLLIFPVIVDSCFPSTRINLSPFTKDFRGGEQLNESIDQFFLAMPFGGAPNTNRDLFVAVLCHHRTREKDAALLAECRLKRESL